MLKGFADVVSESVEELIESGEFSQARAAIEKIDDITTRGRTESTLVMALMNRGMQGRSFGDCAANRKTILPPSRSVLCDRHGALTI